eukprot:617407-Pyramimonas_sp.AAC.1
MVPPSIRSIRRLLQAGRTQRRAPGARGPAEGGPSSAIGRRALPDIQASHDQGILPSVSRRGTGGTP